MDALQVKEARSLMTPAAQAKLLEPLGAIFSRREMREHCNRYIGGLMKKVERKNSWQLAEALGDQTPYRTQTLLGRSTWEAERAVSAMQRVVASQTRGSKSYLILDDTGFIKKGGKSVGVQSQYCGRSGKVDNCQIGVFLALASEAGTFLVDRRLYMPRQWVDAKRRRAEAKVPDHVTYQSKPELGMEMLKSAKEQGLKAAWILGDSIYGRDKGLRRMLEEQHQAYILATSSNTYVWRGFRQWKLSQIARSENLKWAKKSCGEGRKGDRNFLWATYCFPEDASEQGWWRGVVFRKSISDPSEVSYAHFFCPRSTTEDELCRAAGQRWRVEECFQHAKSEVGLAEYEVRNWQGWHRHTALAMWALTLLVLSQQQVKKRPQMER